MVMKMRLLGKNREDENEVEHNLFEIEEREEIIPKSTLLYIKDIAKRPLMARAILYLDKHGLTYQKELEEYLNCSQPALSVLMKKLNDLGLVKIIPQGQLKNAVDKRLIYYRLPNLQLEAHQKIIGELTKWYDYEALKTLETYIKPYIWVNTSKLRDNEKFNKMIFRKFGLNFKSAIDIMASSPIFFTEKEEGEIVAVKRKFDSCGRRIKVDQTEPRFADKPTIAEPKIEEIEIGDEIEELM